MKTVKHNSDALPPLTEDKLARLAALSKGRGSKVDTRDLPELTEKQMANAVRGKFYKPVKQQITARVDADVLDWLKSQGKGYQSRMNAILREVMLKSG